MQMGSINLSFPISFEWIGLFITILLAACGICYSLGRISKDFSEKLKKLDKFDKLDTMADDIHHIKEEIESIKTRVIDTLFDVVQKQLFHTNPISEDESHKLQELLKKGRTQGFSKEEADWLRAIYNKIKEERTDLGWGTEICFKLLVNLLEDFFILEKKVSEKKAAVA